MSVTAYDSSFSFRQNELATKGDQGPRGMTAEQYEKFKESPFMKKAKLQEEQTWTMTSERDKQRKQRDPAFNPQDSDFTAPKAFNYEKMVNYYKVLGVDEYASVEEVKKAYKKLSLLYHPDKTANLPKEEQEEHAAIFIELKNAYLTLGDQATRRQYDRDRDHLTAGETVNGFKKKAEKVPFDATAVLKKLQENQKPPGKVTVVELACKVEKFFYGGTKRYMRNRRVIRQQFEFYEDKHFRIDLPKGAQDKWECSMKGGDMNRDTQPDTMKFIVSSKEHPVLDRHGFDLHIKKPILLKPDAHLQPFLNFDLHTVGGRLVLLWGRNPFYSQVGSANAELNVTIQGEAIGPSGLLHFNAKLEAPKGGIDSNLVVVSVVTTYTKIHFHCSVHMDSKIENLQQAIRDVLEWPDEQDVNIAQPSDTKFGIPFQGPSTKLGTVRDVILDSPVRIYEVPMPVRRARELLNSVNAFASSEQFGRRLRKCMKSRGKPEYLRLVSEQWQAAAQLAPLYGYYNDFEGLQAALQRALWVVRDEPDGPTLHSRFHELGFHAKQPLKAKVIKRRKLPSPPLDLFLARNGLGPPSWGPSSENMPDPGSETDPEQSDDLPDEPPDVFDDTYGGSSGSPNAPRNHRQAHRVHGDFAAAVHPEMLKRAKKREDTVPTCNLELTPILRYGDGLQLYTSPTCYVYFYSNLKQAWTVRPGHLRPLPCFAVALSCPAGAKRAGRTAWLRLRHRLVPMLRQTAFLLFREARGILPRSLRADSSFDAEAYTTQEGMLVARPGDAQLELDEELDHGEGSEEEREILALARKRAGNGAAANLGGGMFDFDDLEDVDRVEEVAEEIRQERQQQRRKRCAAREVWRRDARQQAKQSEYFKAAEARRLSEVSTSFADSGVAKAEALVWKQMARKAFQYGDYFVAQLYYSEELARLPADDGERRAVVHSNRSVCLAKVRHFEAALEDARQATQLRPTWGRAWARFGSASASLGRASSQDARDAWFKAVAFDPSSQHIEGLSASYKSDFGINQDLVQEHQEKGNEALRVQESGAAIAHYTVAIANVPPPPLDPKKKDELPLLRSVLFANRCLALSRHKLWDLALEDGQRAVDSKEDYAKAHIRLGVAQLGCSLNEQAYVSFANALRHDENEYSARKGREICLGLIPRWESRLAMWRRARFARDIGRPFGDTNIYAMSEVHYDNPQNEEWANSIHATKFLDDVLLITGNLADSFRVLERAFTCLRPKFRRVFYVPGNHELWIVRTEAQKFPDSLCKLWAIMELCDRFDIDIFPAAVCKDVYIVPLLSWCNAAFDTRDPFPNPKSEANRAAKWPIDRDQQVWRYMLRLNQANLDKPYHGTVITFSHYAPRTSCPVFMEKDVAKTSGCPELDEQVRDIRSSCHVYGHTLCRFNQTVDGVKYVHRPLLVEVDFDGTLSKDSVTRVFNGSHLCFDMVDI